MTKALTPLFAALVLAGCASLEPSLPEAKPDVPLTWPIPASTGAGRGTVTYVADAGANAIFAVTNDRRVRAIGAVPGPVAPVTQAASSLAR